MPSPVPSPVRAPSRRRLLAAAALSLLAPRLAAAAESGAGHRVRPWPAAQRVPALSLSSLDGVQRSPAQARGLPLLLNFWASWCEPCVAEMPSLSRLAQRHAGRLQVWGVNYRETPERIREFLQQVNADFPQLLDAEGEAMRAWTPRVLPSTVLLDARGRPRFTVVGELDWDGEEAQRLLAPWLPAAAPRR